MQNNKPIYHSKGISPRTRKLYTIYYRGCLVFGIILMFLPLVSDAPSDYVFVGVLFIALGLIFSKLTKHITKGSLLIFDTHLQGVATNVVNSSRRDLSFEEIRKSFQSKPTPFQLQYEDISNVQKSSLILITLSSGDQQYTLPVQDPQRAYDMICDKVYGDSSANRCIRCGGTISATSQECPQCGHLTRFGKINQETSAKQRSSQGNQVTTAIGIAIGIVGLLIFFPSYIKLNEISAYGELYAAFHPVESKQLIFKVLAGFILAVSGFCYPAILKLINKLQGK